MFSLTGRVAIVTGASRGIGRAIAVTLARQGASVVAVARGDHAAAVAEEIAAAGGQAIALAVDVTDASAVAGMVSQTLERFGKVDVLVNNAGIARDQLMLRMKPEDWQAVLATNLTAARLTDDERAAHRIHKVPFDIALEAPPYRIIGTILLHPGSEPDSLLERGTQMFAAVRDPVVLFGGVAVDLHGAETVLVNRFYLRGVEQVDRRTGEKHLKLPGAPLGGVSWQDRSR